jgi:protein involved in polysaccharide export with SLBB domain
MLVLVACHPHASFVPIRPSACTAGGEVSILGAVAKPGRYACTGWMTMRRLVALAGGLVEASKPMAVNVTRGGVVYRILYDGTIDASDLPDFGLANDDDVYVDIPAM